jgi:hypothetical protein
LARLELPDKPRANYKSLVLEHGAHSRDCGIERDEVKSWLRVVGPGVTSQFMRLKLAGLSGFSAVSGVVLVQRQPQKQRMTSLEAPPAVRKSA